MARALCLFLLLQVGDYVEPLNRARVEFRAGRFAGAEKALLEVLNAVSNNQAARAATLTELGDAYLALDELHKAEQVYSQALAIHRRLKDKDGVALNLRDLGALYSLQGRHDEAIDVLKDALKVTKETGNSVLTGQVLNSLGIVYYRQKNINKAETYFNKALELVSTAGIPFDVSQIYNNLGVIAHEKRDYKRAEELLKTALSLTESVLNPTHPDLTFTLSALAVVYTDAGKYADAEIQFRRALNILEPHKSVLETRVARLLHSLGRMYNKAGRTSEADAVLAQSAALARRNIHQHLDMVQIVESYSAWLKIRGNTQQAEELRREARRARVSASLVISAHQPKR